MNPGQDRTAPEAREEPEPARLRLRKPVIVMRSGDMLVDIDDFNALLFRLGQTVANEP
jgi:hypothetical protein